MSFIPVANRNRAWFIDLDGTIFRQADRWPEIHVNNPIESLLPGVKELLTALHMKGDKIIICTARPRGYRNETEWQLRNAGLMWDELLMGLPTGQRILINDRKPEDAQTQMAIAINLDRDMGVQIALIENLFAETKQEAEWDNGGN